MEGKELDYVHSSFYISETPVPSSAYIICVVLSLSPFHREETEVFRITCARSHV